METATYGSEFVAARIATEQIVDLRYTLMAMGVPIEECSWLIGDNRSVVTSSTIPHSKLNKRHNALSYHKVRSCVAAGFLKFVYAPGKFNLSDPLTKFLSYAVLMPLINATLFWRGETFRASDSLDTLDWELTGPRHGECQVSGDMSRDSKYEK